MAESMAWLSEDHGAHPVLASGIAQCQLAHIHPFLDGNGRASRLLYTPGLHQAGCVTSCDTML
ncbi:MAG: Fic family protein [Thermoleophilia bacterium]|nr:Fic family protein [Thermoleophilia bacterium]